MSDTDWRKNALAQSKSLLIHHPQFLDIIEKIEECQELTADSAEPRCLLVYGCPGVGKTTVMRSFANRFPLQETETGVKIPVFYMMTPSPVTVKTMSQSMLMALGEPAAHKFNSQPLMNQHLAELLKDKCEVNLVVLDEFHHLFDFKTNKVLADVSEWLKTIIKSTQKTFVLVGTDSVCAILEANKQLGRFFRHVNLKPFTWDPRSAEKCLEFARFIRAAEKHIGVPLCPGEPSEIVLAAVHQATGGVASNIIILYRESLVYMEKTERDVLTMEVLSEAYQTGLQAYTKAPNPFYSKPRAQRKIKPQDPPDSVSLKPAITKPPKPNVTAILTKS